MISANHTYDGLIKSQQKPVHHVKHTVHGSHLSQDSRKKKIVAPVPTQSVNFDLFISFFEFKKFLYANINDKIQLLYVTATKQSYRIPMLYLFTEILTSWNSL